MKKHLLLGSLFLLSACVGIGTESQVTKSGGVFAAGAETIATGSALQRPHVLDEGCYEIAPSPLGALSGTAIQRSITRSVICGGGTPTPTPSPIPVGNDGPNLYVDCLNGDDRNSGDHDTNPVKTLTQVSQWVHSAHSQDLNIYLKRGVSCYGSLQVEGWRLQGTTGQTQKNISILPYGDVSLPKPVITGSMSRPLTWESLSGVQVKNEFEVEIPHLSFNGNVYRAHLDSSVTSFQDFVVGNEPQLFAQYPNLNVATRTPVENFELTSSVDSVIVNLPPLAYGVSRNATLAFHPNAWAWARYPIYSYNSSARRVTLQTLIANDVRSWMYPGGGAFLIGVLAALDVPGEYYYDYVNNYLYYYPLPGAPPPAQADFSMASQGQFVFFGYGSLKLNVVIQDIQILNAGGDAVSALGIGSLDVERVEIRNPLKYGINISSESVVVSDSEISQAPHGGIKASVVTDAKVLKNKIQNIGMRLGVSGVGSLAGIGVSGSNITALIASNVIRGIGYSGITMGVAKGSIEISKNKIEDVLNLSNDGGFIYLSNLYSGLYSNELPSGYTSGFIARNEMRNVSRRGGFHTGNPGAEVGVYLDFGTSGLQVLDNRVINGSGVFGGYFVLGGHDNTFTNNTVEGLPLVSTYPDRALMDMDWFSYWQPLYPYNNLWTNNHCYASELTKVVDPILLSSTVQRSIVRERACVELIHHGFDPDR